jgi:hypothetical protein
MENYYTVSTLFFVGTIYLISKTSYLMIQTSHIILTNDWFVLWPWWVPVLIFFINFKRKSTFGKLYNIYSSTLFFVGMECQIGKTSHLIIQTSHIMVTNDRFALWLGWASLYPQKYIYTSRKPVRCTKNKLKLNLKNYWSNYDFYCLLYFI